MKKSDMLKVIVFVPITHLKKMQQAIGDAGGGSQGNYSHCGFVTYGEGHFIPSSGAHPFIGTVGKSEVVEEAKFEFLCSKNKLEKIVTIIHEVHPYEEVAFDIFERWEV